MFPDCTTLGQFIAHMRQSIAPTSLRQDLGHGFKNSVQAVGQTPRQYAEYLPTLQSALEPLICEEMVADQFSTTLVEPTYIDASHDVY